MEKTTEKVKKSQSSDSKNESPGSKSYRRSVILCSVIVAGFVLLISFFMNFSSYKTNIIDDIGEKLSLQQNLYAVILDAGSTGSRVLVPSFYKALFSGNVKLKEDLFLQTKPGLSNFADSPAAAGEKISELLQKAMEFIPKSKWSQTPVALRATAGLRLLPGHTAEDILKEVQAVIDNSPFLSNNNSVAIMDGKDEGLFSWFTVNFLLDRLHGDLSRTVLTLDLGGGSVQISFVPHKTSTTVLEEEYVHPVSMLGHDVDMYSYSYLGLGLMSVREEVLLKENFGGNTDVTTSCFHPKSNKTWKHGRVTYSVSGKNGTSVDFHRCYKLVQLVVLNAYVDKPPDMEKHEIVAFSYFFDRAAETGLVDKELGGSVTTQDFKKMAEKSCKNQNSERPFLCLDLIFITSLLEDGFGLKPTTPIMLLDTVDGHEISWALGAAYHIVENGL